MLGFLGSTLVFERTRSRRTRECGHWRVSRWRLASDSSVPSSAEEALRRWKSSRNLRPIRLDGSKKTLSVLFICDNCWRAIFAEKQLMKQAEAADVGASLLALSAGFNTKPGDPIPFQIIEEAAKKGIDLNEEKPCASFSLRNDLENHDYIICLDRRVRGQVLSDAEKLARTLKEDYTRWESKIRLLRDIAGDQLLTKSAWELDISKFNTIDNETVMDDIESACAAFLKVLLEMGLEGGRKSKE
ncbi:hypothetical protein NDN08_003775 [Rhodosorus marinus]|uniref:Phosphotyrosine protein phosphatase I domain-containing protein n=1 Tax=Rhodosorus marinus TaxID=101924 RepID=A0AAV8UGE8_9RHOD|nr:hypothetical protein NDN08_003775 [Rhodosorus marinus]